MYSGCNRFSTPFLKHLQSQFANFSFIHTSVERCWWRRVGWWRLFYHFNTHQSVKQSVVAKPSAFPWCSLLSCSPWASEHNSQCIHATLFCSFVRLSNKSTKVVSLHLHSLINNLQILPPLSRVGLRRAEDYPDSPSHSVSLPRLEARPWLESAVTRSSLSQLFRDATDASLFKRPSDDTRYLCLKG